MGFWHIYLGIEGGGGDVVIPSINRPCLTVTPRTITLTMTARSGPSVTVTERGCDG